MTKRAEDLPGTVFIGTLVADARDLIENPEECNPEYLRGQLELIHDVTGMDMTKLREIMFPRVEPLMEYAIDLLGGEPGEAADWQAVARELFELSVAVTHPNRKRRTVDFYPHEADPRAEPGFHYVVDVVMSWLKDDCDATRMEHGCGDTPEDAWKVARAIAAAFMFEEDIRGDEWPKNHIDHVFPTVETGSPITVELTEEQLRAALDVIAKRVSETNEQGTPLFMAERVIDSALMAHEQTEGGS